MNSYVVDVKRPIELLQMLIQELGDDETTLELEGDLSRLDVQCLEGEVKLRAWTQCGDSMAVNIVLSEMNKTALIKSLLPRLGLRKRVYGITLKKAGQMLFHAYDNFCPWPDLSNRHSYQKVAQISSQVSKELLDKLVETNVIREYRPNPCEDRRKQRIRVKRRVTQLPGSYIIWQA
jgi:hypothetical protein